MKVSPLTVRVRPQDGWKFVRGLTPKEYELLTIGLDAGVMTVRLRMKPIKPKRRAKRGA